MANTDIVGHLTYALGRALDQLDKTEDFSSVHATALLENINQMHNLRGYILSAGELCPVVGENKEEAKHEPDEVPAPDPVPDPVLDPVPAPAPVPAPEPAPTEETVKTYSKGEVRGALGTARTKGLDVPGFIKNICGVDSFSKVPEGAYGKLMDALREAGY